METRANFVAVGAFVLALLAGAFGFAWWLSDPTEAQRSNEVIVVFPGDVSGLTLGAPVYFNGIKVGDVKLMRLDRTDPNKVYVHVSVDNEAPLRQDTVVQLGFQGLTGVAYVQFSGGSTEAPPLIEPGRPTPSILAEKSAFEDILASARELLGSVNRIAEKTAEVVDGNTANINAIVGNIRQFSDALGDNSDQVSAALASVSDVAISFGDLAGRVGSLSERAEAILAAIDPAKVGETIDGTAALASGFGDIAEDLPALMADLKASTDQLSQFTTGLNATLANVDGVITSVDPEVIQGAMEGIQSVAQALANRTTEIESIIASTDALAGNLADASAPLAARQEALGDIVDQAQGAMTDLAAASRQVEPLLDTANAAVGAFDGEAIAQILSDIGSVTSELSARSEAIGSTVDNSSEAAKAIADLGQRLVQSADQLEEIVANTNLATRNLSQATQKVDPILDDVASTIAAVDAESVGRSVANIETVTDTLANQSATFIDTLEDTRAVARNTADLTQRLAQSGDQIDQIIANTQATTSNFAAASDQLPGLVDQADRFVASLDLEGIQATLTNVQRLTETFASRTDEIGATLDNLSGASADIKTVTGTVAGRSSEIDQIIVDATEVAAELNSVASRASKLMDALSGFMSTDATGGLIQEATAAAQSIRQTAEAFGRRADDISNGVANFTTRGLQDAEALIADGRRTVQSLDRLLTRVERNPREFLFGAESGPRDFNARRY